MLELFILFMITKMKNKQIETMLIHTIVQDLFLW